MISILVGDTHWVNTFVCAKIAVLVFAVDLIGEDKAWRSRPLCRLKLQCSQPVPPRERTSFHGIRDNDEVLSRNVLFTTSSSL